MPSPTSAINRFELGSTFEEFDLRMNMLGFIAHQVFRPRVVAKNAGDFGKVPLKQLLSSKSTKRSPGSGYARDTWEFDKAPFAIEEFGKEEPLDDSQLEMYGDIVDAERISADRAEEAVLNEYERDVASTVFNTTTWTGAALTTNIATPWSTYSTATPINNVAAACEKVAASGVEPNAIVMNRAELRNLMLCDQIRDSVKYTEIPSAEKIRSALSGLFDLKHIIVAGGFKNIANEGQDASISRIWGNDSAMVCRVAETDDPKEVCIGRTFIWDGDGPAAPGDGGRLAVIMEEYREEKIRGTVLRARNNRDIVTMYVQAGHLLTNI